MPPKTAVGADEDVKFLLTVIKQMAGTVSLHLRIAQNNSLTLAQIDWQEVSDELDLPSKGAA